jgi:hypothetical protein
VCHLQVFEEQLLSGKGDATAAVAAANMKQQPQKQQQQQASTGWKSSRQSTGRTIL